MAESKDQEEFKYSCDLCNKKFPSGKSLGGHKRSHGMANAQKNKSNLKKVRDFNVFSDYDENDDDDDDEYEDDSDVFGADPRENANGYELRENPKKTWRMVDDSSSGKQEQVEIACEQCGKIFPSVKALCGHMGSHSDKERYFKQEDDHSCLGLSMESHSDNDNNSFKHQTRSLNFFTGKSSSFHSEIDQYDDNDATAAHCLVMISRDAFGWKNSFDFNGESSDNNSGILEGGSSNYVGITEKKKDLNFLNDNMDVKQVAVKDVIKVRNPKIENSDSGYDQNGDKEHESDDSVDGFVGKNGFKKARIGFESRVDKDNSFDEDYDRKGKNSTTKKGKKYECRVCGKTFKTHQALGGHIISHKKNGGNSLDFSNSKKKVVQASRSAKNMASKKSKKVKGHICPYCLQGFKSGQALGGHKRTHTGRFKGKMKETGWSKIKKRVRSSPRQPPPPTSPESNEADLIDLNLPPSVE